MRIISKKILREFWKVHSGAEQPLKAWHAKVKLADWKTPSDVKSDYRNASFIANNRVIFNIKGNTYRLVAAVNYDFGTIYIRFVGSHNEYYKIDATII
ncbi:MAG: type II toxin-antitoxin system HigB family toxin [Thermodesulfobacteriota bacterium]|nr:type II toxin-antitoxin system HigB family toxin [Thermodesulfobacteriota bacterium]